MTAGNGSIGRSDTFQNLHISEYAFWPKDKAEILTGLFAGGAERGEHDGGDRIHGKRI